jgi:hypothetical protein
MNDDASEYEGMSDETKDAILESLSCLPSPMMGDEIITMIVMLLDGYGFGALDAMELLHDAAQIYVTHCLTEGYDPLRPN